MTSAISVAQDRMLGGGGESEHVGMENLMVEHLHQIGRGLYKRSDFFLNALRD